MIRVLLHNPAFPHNVGQAVRAASCFGADSLWISGDRVELEGHGKANKGGYRLPREERMREYVPIHKSDRPFDDDVNQLLTPVAIELVPGSESLVTFNHPEDALYVFGPEDGSLPHPVLRHCHRFVRLPMLHCANLASAIYITLYDRHAKRVLAGLEPQLDLKSMGKI